MAEETKQAVPSSYTVSVTVIQKIVATNDYEQIKIKCHPSDSIGTLRDSIHQHLNKSSSEYCIHIAYKGKVLKSNASTLQSTDIIPNPHRPIPKLYVTLKKLDDKPTITKSQNKIEMNAMKLKPESPPDHTQEHVPEPSNDIDNTVPGASDIMDLQYENLTGNEDDHKQCRLCFSSEDENPLLGQLFQPCRCSGTMKWIHVKCLNEWRAVAPNARSYYRCDQCQYEYNLRRAEWADMVAHPNTSKIISVFVLLIGTILFGILTFKLPLGKYTYDMIQWSPIEYFSRKQCRNRSPQCETECNSWLPWSECPRRCWPCYLLPLDEWTQFYIEVFFSGVLCLSLVGLIAQRELIWRHKWVFIMTLAQSTRVWRLFILVGCGHSFYGLLNAVRIVVKRFLFQFGERILSVDHSE
eukprot:304996_1